MKDIQCDGHTGGYDGPVVSTTGADDGAGASGSGGGVDGTVTGA